DTRRRVESGGGEDALEQLRELSAAHPEAPGVAVELERLRVRIERLAEHSRVDGEAGRVAARGEEAWSVGDPAGALKYAEQALAISVSDERAIRIAAMA